MDSNASAGYEGRDHRPHGGPEFPPTPTRRHSPPHRITVTEADLIPVELARVVLHEGSPHQHIYLVESDGERSFPIVIGKNEAEEICRVIKQDELLRPMTHQLTSNLIEALGGRITAVDIVDLRKNTFFANVTLANEAGDLVAVVDARPSDAIALALRARCPLRVSRSVLERAAEEPPSL